MPPIGPVMDVGPKPSTIALHTVKLRGLGVSEAGFLAPPRSTPIRTEGVDGVLSLMQASHDHDRSIADSVIDDVLPDDNSPAAGEYRLGYLAKMGEA